MLLQSERKSSYTIATEAFSSTATVYSVFDPSSPMTRVAPAFASGSAHDSSGSTTTTFFSQRSGRRSSSGQGATERDGGPHPTGFTPRGENEAGPTTAPKGGPQLVTTLVHEAGSFSSVHSSQALSRHELGTTQFVRTVVHRTVAKRSARRQAHLPRTRPHDPRARPLFIHPAPPPTACITGALCEMTATA